MKRTTTIIRRLMLATCMLLCNFLALHAQTSLTLDTGNYCTALAKDAGNNIYLCRYNSGDDNYEIIRYANGTGTPVVIYSDLAYSPVDYPWGLAVAGNGDVYIAASNVDNKIIKLTYNSALDDYSASDLLTGNYYAALALDADDNLYTTEYDGSANYTVVKYPSGSTTGTTLYGSLHLGGSYPTGLAVAANGDVYVTDGFNAATGDNGHVYKLTAADGYSVSVISSGKFSTSLALDPDGNLYCSEYDGATTFVLNKYTGGSGSPAAIATLLISSGDFFPWGIAALNSKNIYFSTGNDDDGSGGAVRQLIDMPETQASGLVFSNIAADGATATWTNGTGSGSIVFIANTTTGSPLPVDNTTYTADAEFGSGAQIGASGWYCVYRGIGTEVNITGLDPATTYRLMAIAYNGPSGSEQYNTTAGTNIGNFTTDDPLPVSLVSFGAQYHDGQVYLSWETQAERNNRQFMLQWSLTGESWSDIGTIASKAPQGNSNNPLAYSFTYDKPVTGTNLFRLWQEDLDGRATVSAIAQVMVDHAGNTGPRIIPNPTKGVFTLTTGGTEAAVSLMDISGRVLYQGVTVAGNICLDISGRPAGTYYVRIANGVSADVYKVVKE